MLRNLKKGVCKRMKCKISCRTAIAKNVINKDIFEREIALCKELNKKNGAACFWGKCRNCGVIPLLHKLHNGTVMENAREIEKVKSEIFK